MLFGEGPQIKNIAADLNKLFRQGSLLNQIGQTVEGDSTADQGTSDLLAARDPVIQEISVGMSGEQSARYTVSGTPPLSLPNSLGKPLKAWSVDVLPYQEGTGDPSPDNVRAIHGTDKVTVWTAGKNLYNSATFQTVTRNGVTCTNNGDGSFTLNGTATTDVYFDIFRPQFAPVIGGVPIPRAEYCFSGAPSGGGAQTYYMYTTPNYHGDYGNGNVFTDIITGGSIYVKSGYTCDNLVFRPQICLASAPNPMEFAPYVTSSQTVLTLPQTVYTGTIGSEGGESRWGEVDLGTLNWSASGSTPHGFYASLPLKYAIGIDIPAMCEAYKYAGTRANAQGYYGNNGEITVYERVQPSYPSECYVVDENYSDAASFKASVQGVKLVTELATPTTFAVPSPTIPTPTGNATTWATAEDGIVDTMEVTYIGKA